MDWKEPDVAGIWCVCVCVCIATLTTSLGLVYKGKVHIHPFFIVHSPG